MPPRDQGGTIIRDTESRGAPGAGIVAYVHCAHCRRYFRSPMQFPTLRQFERAAGVGLIAQCPDCYRIFACDKSNMYCDTTGAGKPETFPAPADKLLGKAS